MLIVIMLNVIMLSVFVLSVVMLCAIMLKVIILHVIMVNVVAPEKVQTLTTLDLTQRRRKVRLVDQAKEETKLRELR